MSKVAQQTRTPLAIQIGQYRFLLVVRLRSLSNTVSLSFFLVSSSFLMCFTSLSSVSFICLITMRQTFYTFVKDAEHVRNDSQTWSK